MAEAIRNFVARFGGRWFIERDPFDIGPGGRYYSEEYTPRFASADKALEHDFINLMGDLKRAAAGVYANA